MTMCRQPVVESEAPVSAGETVSDAAEEERPRRRYIPPIREFGSFAGVGMVAYLVDTGLFNLAFYSWGLNTFNAKAIATVVAATLAFIGNRFWTWRKRPRSALHREYLWYFVFNAIGLGLNLLWVAAYQLALYLWPNVFDNPIALNLVVNVAGVGFASLFRFHAYRTWVFSDTVEKPRSDAYRSIP